MTNLNASVPILAVLLLTTQVACGRIGAPRVDLPGAGAGNEGTAAMVENRVWIDADPGAEPGTFLAFVADGTLVAGSCAAPARLGAWLWVDDATLVWDDAGIRVRAEVGLVGPRELVLVPRPAGLAPERSFRAVQSPVTCPG